MKVGFIGFGRMGSVIAEGALRAGLIKRRDVIAYAPSPSTRRKIKKLGLALATDAAQVVRASEIVLLCVKPQKMADVFETLSTQTLGTRRRCFVSVAAGVTIKKLQARVGRPNTVIRVMPNTPALLGAGMSVVASGRGVASRHQAWVKKVLSSVGDVVTAPETWMDAVTALSGSGPAYVFYLAEALVEGAVKTGLPKETARRLVRQTIFGAGRMLKETGTDAAVLRHQVTSPGGTTAAAIEQFEKRKMKPLVAAALSAATKRSKELGK
jgi:pyrroline-5-carboxylate reductase